MKFCFLSPQLLPLQSEGLGTQERSVSTWGYNSGSTEIGRWDCHLAFVALYFIEPTGYRKGLLDGLILIVREMWLHSGAKRIQDVLQIPLSISMSNSKVNGKLQQAEICRTSDDSTFKNEV